MVADKTPEELVSGLEDLAPDVQAHRTIRVLQVRGRRPGREIHPAADHRMAHEAIVRFVGIAQHHGGGHLAVDHRPRTDRGPANRPADEPGIRAHPQRTLETSTAAHFHAAFQDHWTTPGVEQDPRFDGSFAERYPGGIPNHRAALGHRVRIAEEFDRVFAQQLLYCCDETVAT